MTNWHLQAALLVQSAESVELLAPGSIDCGLLVDAMSEYATEQALAFLSPEVRPACSWLCWHL